MSWRRGLLFAVFALLLLVLALQFKSRQEQALSQRARSELRTLATALELYYVHHANTFPDDLSGLVREKPRLLSALSLDPFGRGSRYGYFKALGKASAYYLVFSRGPDRRPAITGIDPEGHPQCGKGSCGLIDDLCITNGAGAGSPNC